MKKIYLQRAKNQIARPNTIRDINKQIVLNYVRDRAPISRAEIARETALQRSTVSAIVDDLQLDGLIEELGTGDSTGGRKPTLLKLKTGIPVAIGVDITPRRTTIALADLAGRILQRETFPTSPDADFMSAQIIERVGIHAAANKNRNLEVGISVPGIADQTTGNVLYIPYFQWSNWDICKQINEQTNLRATVDNDANAIALAELWFGEERNRKDRNFITVLVAEGIGTGIITNGQLVQGINGAAGEFGHVSIEQNGLLCKCGNRGCWEMYASNTAAIDNYVRATKGTRGKHKTETAESEKPTFEDILFLAEQGDAKASEALDKMGEALGIGLAMLITGMSPELIVIIGEITRAWDKIEPALKKIIDRHLPATQNKTRIIPAEDILQPRLRGSASLILQKHFGAPIFA